MRYIAVTLGDPAGIGPEIVAKLLTAFHPADHELVAVGSREVLARELAGQDFVSPPKLESVTVEDLAGGETEVSSRRRDTILVLDSGPAETPSYGRDSALGGEHAFAALETGSRLAQAGRFSALVTAPLSKKSLSLAGLGERGHTEILAELTGSDHVHMMMASAVMRVTLMTRHIPISAVPGALTRELVVDAGLATWDALRRLWGYERPLLAMAGLNPHAGEGGLFGLEEERVLRPALEELRRLGVAIEGPFSADTLFLGHNLDKFQAFLACYHDQGLIPFKSATFGRGVNVTLGLPFVRTSVDHGTAYDIAGHHHASTDSLKEAVELAILLSRNHERDPSRDFWSHERNS